MSKQSDFLKSLEIVRIGEKVYDGRIKQGQFQATQRKLRKLEDSLTYLSFEANEMLEKLDKDGFFSF